MNYIVKGKEIIIVDEFTGRTMAGRRWSDGLHQVESGKGCCMGCCMGCCGVGERVLYGVLWKG